MAKMPAFMMAKFEKKDEASDKKAGIKENSKADMKKDAKMKKDVKMMKGVKAASGGMMPAKAYTKGGMVRATKPAKKGC